MGWIVTYSAFREASPLNACSRMTEIRFPLRLLSGVETVETQEECKQIDQLEVGLVSFGASLVQKLAWRHPVDVKPNKSSQKTIREENLQCSKIR